MGKVQVDDRDDRKIQYRGDWRPVGNATRTLRSVTEWGSTATFSFNGSYVGVFGSIPSGDGENIRVDFQVDDDPVVTTVRVAGSDPSDDDVWFDAGPLDSQEHTLVIWYLGNDREFLFDYIEYEDTVLATAPNSPSTSEPGPSTAPLPLPSSEATSGSMTSVSPGTLAAAVVGAVVATAALMVLAFFIRKRRQGLSRPPDGGLGAYQSSTGGTSHIAPFNAENSSNPYVKNHMAYTGASLFSGSGQSRHTIGDTAVAGSYGVFTREPNRFTLSQLSAGAATSPPAYGSENDPSIRRGKV